MIAVGLLVASMSVPSPRPWRLIDRHSLHVGIRPHVLVSPDEFGAALTVQISL